MGLCWLHSLLVTFFWHTFTCSKVAVPLRPTSLRPVARLLIPCSPRLNRTPPVRGDVHPGSVCQRTRTILPVGTLTPPVATRPTRPSGLHGVGVSESPCKSAPASIVLARQPRGHPWSGPMYLDWTDARQSPHLAFQVEGPTQTGTTRHDGRTSAKHPDGGADEYGTTRDGLSGRDGASGWNPE